jgi:hypothetical protein
VVTEHGAEFDEFVPWIASTQAWPDFEADPKRRMASVFCHILGAQFRWLIRCWPELRIGADSPAGWLAGLNQAWLEAIDQIPSDRVIAYRNTSGLAFDLPFAQIVGQVLDHGTYHRGQLREILFNAFPGEHPETGYINFLLARKAAGTL